MIQKARRHVRMILGGTASSLALAVVGIAGVNAYGVPAIMASPVSIHLPQPTPVGVVSRLADDGNGAPAPTVTPALTPAPTARALSSASHAVAPSVLGAATSAATDAQVLARLQAVPEAVWAAGGTPAQAATEANEAASAGGLTALVAYDIPGRDCGSYSSGGAASAADYDDWIDGLARGIGGRPVTVILEPDGLANGCVDDSLIAQAGATLKAAGAKVYLDAGNSGWIPAATMAARLNAAGIANLDGFSVNVSNFYTTAQEKVYGHQISALVGGKHFVIDTSRNGNGSNGQWCNPSGRALGNVPTTATGDPLVDAYLWIKRAGESDGTCNGGPSAGVFWPSYALSLARAAGW